MLHAPINLRPLIAKVVNDSFLLSDWITYREEISFQKISKNKD
jgi:hypothetical protein